MRDAAIDWGMTSLQLAAYSAVARFAAGCPDDCDMRVVAICHPDLSRVAICHDSEQVWIPGPLPHAGLDIDLMQRIEETAERSFRHAPVNEEAD